jgi:hypothetical protein
MKPQKSIIDQIVGQIHNTIREMDDSGFLDEIA